MSKISGEDALKALVQAGIGAILMTLILAGVIAGLGLVKMALRFLVR